MTVCEIPSDLTTFADLLTVPNYCVSWFWLGILLFIFCFVAYRLYKTQEQKQGEGDLLSSMGVSSIVTVILSTVGSLIEDSNGITLVSRSNLLIVIAFAIVIMFLWWMSKDD